MKPQPGTRCQACGSSTTLANQEVYEQRRREVVAYGRSRLALGTIMSIGGLAVIAAAALVWVLLLGTPGHHHLLAVVACTGASVAAAGWRTIRVGRRLVQFV